MTQHRQMAHPDTCFRECNSQNQATVTLLLGKFMCVDLEGIALITVLLVYTNLNCQALVSFFFCIYVLGFPIPICLPPPSLFARSSLQNQFSIHLEETLLLSFAFLSGLCLDWNWEFSEGLHIVLALKISHGTFSLDKARLSLSGP